MIDIEKVIERPPRLHAAMSDLQSAVLRGSVDGVVDGARRALESVDAITPWGELEAVSVGDALMYDQERIEALLMVNELCTIVAMNDPDISVLKYTLSCIHYNYRLGLYGQQEYEHRLDEAYFLGACFDAGIRNMGRLN